jgi:outer membrane lipoprotein SlyB
MKFRMIASTTCAAALTLLAGCSSSPLRNDGAGTSPGYVGGSQSAYQGNYQGNIGNSAQLGSVTQIETVPTASRGLGAGAVIGAVLGGVLGNQVGRGSGNALATGAGVVGGAVVGNEIEKRNQTGSNVYRVSVRFDNGQGAQYDYQQVDNLQVGDRVKVENGLLYRF